MNRRDTVLALLLDMSGGTIPFNERYDRLVNTEAPGIKIPQSILLRADRGIE